MGCKRLKGLYQLQVLIFSAPKGAATKYKIKTAMGCVKTNRHIPSLLYVYKTNGIQKPDKVTSQPITIS